MDSSKTIQSALAEHQAGNLTKAEDLYRKVLTVQPENFYALHYLGVLYTQLGQYDPAINHLEKALQVNPSDADTYYNLAIAFQGKGQIDDALKTYQKTVQLNPQNADAYVNLGIINKEKGMLDRAMNAFRQALQINQEHLAARYNLGYVLQAAGKYDEAIGCYMRALESEPNLVGAYYNLGFIFRDQGRLDEAVSAFKKALQFSPDFADIYNGLGVVYQELGEPEAAIEYFEKALQLNPASIDAYNNLGIIFQEKGQPDIAVSYYQRALQIDPHSSETYTNLGSLFHLQGKQDESIAAFKRVIEYDPSNFTARWTGCFSQIPILYQNHASIQSTRQRYRDALMELSELVDLKNGQDIDIISRAVGRQQPFFLAYQGLNDHDLQKAYGELICRIMAAKYPQFADHRPVPPQIPGKPLRVGIVSGFFYSHSNWKLRQGWVTNIDTQRIAFYGYYTGMIRDHMTDTARKHFHSFREDIRSFHDLCKIIRDDDLHVLIFPEIGMDPTTIRLAALRLAPVQCTSWGHPETSGLPTIDYFLSSDLMEPSEADQHYTERLIRLPNLSISYAPLDIPEIETNRDAFGVRPGSILFLCCQSLFKYLPQYDGIYHRIAQQVGDCQFIFISHKSSWITEQYRLRLCKAFEENGLNSEKYLIFLPRLSQEQFHALNSLADVYLDSMDWSGCNTTLEALACNLPVVTLPGKLMRGRHSTAILKMMGLNETIAESLDDYIAIAVELGKDAYYRKYISDIVSLRKHHLYNDGKCVTALEDFFEKSFREKL
jgi:protein O-GlcNAc transferase